MGPPMGESPRSSPSTKICGLCGEDCSTRPRTRDRRGRYYCRDCYDDEVTRRRRGEPRAEPVTGEVAGLLEEIEPAPSVVRAPCPACGELLEPGAILCVHCGASTRGDRGRKTRLRSGPGVMQWLWSTALGFGVLVTAFWLVAALVLVLVLPNSDAVSVLTFLAFMTAFFIHLLWLLRAAYRDGGFRTQFLCYVVPLYYLYYVYGISERPRLKGTNGDPQLPRDSRRSVENQRTRRI